jgi:dsDNA-specific endonuclease/ATPase MutS2
MEYLDRAQRQQVGFSFVMEKLEVITPYGLDEKKNIRPFARDESAQLLKELDSIELLVENIQCCPAAFREIDRVFSRMRDIRGSIKRCRSGWILDDVELFEIKGFSLLMGELIECLEKSGLHMEGIELHSLEDIVSTLDIEGLRVPTFHIYDGYSERLTKIRKEKRRLEDMIRAEADSARRKALMDERLVLVVSEDEEELEIRKKLTGSILSYSMIIEEDLRSAGRLDFLIAKARLAIEYGGVRPSISSSMEVHLEGMTNPWIAKVLKEKGRHFTPVSISLISGTTVITGANMGGKSVALKTVVLNLMLGQMGFFVFCRRAVFPLLDFIYFISDELQSVYRGLSTFGAEIVKLKEAAAHIKYDRGFLALDEFARGTNPGEGLNLVKSLCEYLDKFESVSLVSTHYDGVIEEGIDHYQVIGLKNADFESIKLKLEAGGSHSAEIIQEYMDYRLEKVSSKDSVPKDALNICTLLGLDEEIINIAREYYRDNEEQEKENAYGK